MRGIARTEPYPHGSKARYDHGGAGEAPCHCEDCRSAKAEYEKRRRRRNAYGRSPWVDAAPVREHVRSLMAPYQGSTDGIGYERIADLAGVNRGVVRALLYGFASQGRPPSERIHRENAQRILALKASDELKAPGATVDSGPSVALARCMASFGIPKRRIGFALRTAYPGLRFNERITVRKAQAVAGLHWELWRRSAGFRRVCACPLPREVEERLLAEPEAS